MKFSSNCDCTGKLVQIYCKIFGFSVEIAKTTCDCEHLEDNDFGVCGILPIIKYLGLKAECSCYYRRDLKQVAGVDSQLSYADSISNHLCLLHQMCIEKDSKIFQANYAKKIFDELQQMLSCLNDHLSQNTYLVNERISLADFYMTYVCYGVFATFFTQATVQASYPHVLRFSSMIAHLFKPINDVLGVVKFAADNFVVKANKSEKPKEEKVAAPKADKKKEKKDDVEDDEDEKPKEKPAPANNYVYSFDMNAWKRHYKNLDWEKQDWQDYFYEHFNPEEMSLWFLEYQFPENFKADWKTKNLFSILLQRTRGNKADKHSFGVFAVTKNPSQDYFNIVGVFLWPGKQPIAEWTEVDGTGSFTHTRLDNFKDEAVKQVIKNVWDWTEEKDIIFNGKNFGPTTGDCETFV